MKAQEIKKLALRYCAVLLREGANTWTVPDEVVLDADNEDFDWRSERWRQAIRDIADQLEAKAKGRSRRIG